MAGKARLLSLVLLVCTLLLSSCSQFGEKPGEPKVREPAKTPTERRRDELLTQIDRKFENPKVHFELGQLYQANGLWTQAEYHYKTALSFDPVHRGAQSARVKVLLASGDTVKAELLADEYMSQTSVSAEDSLLLGLAFQNQELDEHALACYQQALHLAPNSAKINRQIGYYYLSKNDKGRALDYLRRSFDLDHNQPEVAGELGRLGVDVGFRRRKPAKGVKKLDKIVDEADKRVRP